MGDLLRSRGFTVLALVFAVLQLATLSRAPAIWLEEIQPRLGPHPVRIFAVAGAICLAFLFAWAFRAGPRNRSAALLGLVLVLGAYALILLVYFGSGDAPAKRAHLLQYGVLGVLTFQAVRVSFRNLRGLLLGLLFVLAVGVVDETLQGRIPSRTFRWKDIGSNFMGAGLGLGAFLCASPHSPLRRKDEPDGRPG